MMAFFQWFHGGGIFMYAILAISIFSLYLFLRKSYMLFIKFSLAEDEVTQAVLRNVETDNIARAVQYCNVKAHPLMKILKAGLTRANKPEKEIRRAMEIAAADEIPELRRLTPIMPHMSNMATLMGLLGTIYGLMLVFQGMEGKDAVAAQKALAHGIAVAFRNTFVGLIVAIPTIIGYIILLDKQTKIIAKVDHGATALLDALINKNKKLHGNQSKE